MDFLTKPLNEIVEAEALGFIQSLREAVAQAQAENTDLQAKLAEAQEQSALAAATAAPEPAVLPKIQVIRHMAGSNVPMTILGTDLADGVLTVHAS